MSHHARVGTERKPRGRRPGGSGTREAILVAARTQFARAGYEGATVRAIAHDAGVDPALIFRFHGSKQALFTAAVEWPFDAEALIAAVADGPRRDMGRRLAMFAVAVWEDPGRREPMMGMVRAATTSPHAAELLRDSLSRRLLTPVGERLGLDEAPLRMSLCATQILGLGIVRHVVRIEPLASLGADELVDFVAPTLQRYLTVPLPRPGRAAR